MREREQYYRDRSPLKYVTVSLRGFLMGAADVIPGVSGGTMALILGIYRELIASLRSFDYTALKLLLQGKLRDFSSHVNLPFLLSLLFGIAAAIISLAKIIPQLLYRYPTSTKAFFFGLIGASVFFVWRQIKVHDSITTALIFFSAISSYLIVGLLPFQTPESLPFIFFSGFIAICAMILPGISGAFILLILGKYLFILESLSNFIHNPGLSRDLAVITVFIAGCAVGLLSFARVLNWLFKKYPDYTTAILTGLMLGSLRKLWPFQKFDRAYQIGQDLLEQYLWFSPQFLDELSFYVRKKGLFLENYFPKSWDKSELLALGFFVFGLALVSTFNYLEKYFSKDTP